ncbi:hypothetical protein M1843_16825 [Isoptericola sp. 4D.3]|uniref:Uncharacterized protein n=1 Tax=Isoptericola peretonis TaxID=2918523 RepID=A0ABT0J7F2_9MICO|nr:hypothetical protein [Isoptericola sp. 4D.3]
MSPAELDERLARLAPTTSPDPERLDAARAALDAALDGPGDPRSRRVGGAHVLDLGDVPAGDAPLGVADDVVVPLDRGRTARERRRRRVRLGVAAAGVVGVVGVGLALSPWGPAPGPASPTAASCLAHVADSAPSENAEPDLAWRTLAHEASGSADATLLRSHATGDTGFCGNRTDGAGSTSTSMLWTNVPPEVPGTGQVAVGGALDGEWYVAWGAAGADVTSLRLHAAWSAGDGSSDSGLVVDARRDGADWSVFLRGEEVPDDAVVSLVWQLDDGTEQSLPLDSGWPEGGAAETVLTQQRRDACTDGPGLPGLRPVIEERYDDLGLTVAVGRGQLVACMQEAVPPYDSGNTMSGPVAAQGPAPDEAVSEVGGSADDDRMMVGRAGDDVARVEVLLADGTVVEGVLSDGYWAAWTSTASEKAWDGARLVWFLEDGSRHERRLVG